MERNDVELIRSILLGDDSAFSDLVNKYQKSVHALAWRKVGDFQVAEEIAQDAFLQAYKKLATLKNTNQFAGWLYVITNNLCHDWHRRKKPAMQSIDATDTTILEKTDYERYLVEQREKESAEHRRELVRKLLEKLPESERTVITLHYLGEMTSEAISRFLGVSVNTIKSRLRRARKRLKEEEQMIRETFGSVQLPNNFTQNIMEQIADIEAITPTNTKPLLPWAALGSAAIIAIMLLGVGNQFLTLFQKPYSLDAHSQTSIEIVDSPIFLDIQPKPEIQRRNADIVIVNGNGSNHQESEAVFASETQGDSENNSILTGKWTPTKSPGEGDINEIFRTSDGSLIVVSPSGIYRMADDESGWVLLNNNVPSETYTKTPMAESNGVLYLMSTHTIYASKNRGVTWESIGKYPMEKVIELFIIDETFYLVMDDGVFISTDVGKNWVLFNDGMENREITTAAAIGNTIFVGTDRGVYRLNFDSWEQLSVGTFRTIRSMTVTDNTIYVVITPNDTELTQDELKTKLIREIMRKETSNKWEIYRSDNLGDTWRKITPIKKALVDLLPGASLMGGSIMAAGEFLIAFGVGNSYRSDDNGETWIDLGYSIDSSGVRDSSILAVNENTFYKESFYKLMRSTDAGESWQPFMSGIVGNRVNNIVVFKDRLYVHSGFELIYSTDGGQTWTNIIDESGNMRLFLYPYMLVANDTLYTFCRDVDNRWRIASLSESNDMLVPVEGVPPVSGYIPNKDNIYHIGDSEKSDISNGLTETKALTDQARNLQAMLNTVTIGGIAVSGNTFYVERDGRLYRSYVGFPEWIDTGFNTGEDFSMFRGGIAVSDETVYVSKEDGHLFHSNDGGKNWNDITTDLLLTFKKIREMVFVDSSVYVVTDKGVLSSHAGDKWQVLTDSSDTIIEIVSLAVEGTTVYGINNSGLYYLNDQEKWEIISSEIPEHVSQFVIHDDHFYVATENRGIFHIPIDKENR